MDISAQTATLIAAVIAAAVSILSLILNLIISVSAESRGAYRKSLENHIEELGNAIHTTLATANILMKTKTEESAKNWREKSDDAQNQLKELYIKMRYPLWGITEGIRTLTRLPDWIENAKKFPEYSKELFIQGKKLGSEIDKTIRNSYIFGRPPSCLERIRVKFAEEKLCRIYEKMKKDDSIQKKE